MLEICMDDDDDDGGAVLAVHDTAAAALNDLDRIAELTAAQLAANGEGDRGFELGLLVRDAGSGAIVVRSCIGG
ncbi:MAG: hypothetical protein ACT4P1_13130 [Sporichthyaceae bacterium]